MNILKSTELYTLKWHVHYISVEAEIKRRGKKVPLQVNEIANVVTDSPKVPIIFSVKGRGGPLIKPTSNWEWLCSRTLWDKF